MGKLKQLAGQTAVYGLSTILGRLLNYLLISLHTRIFLPEAYGVITELYAYATFIMILLTYGMETGFFRFTESEENKETVYSTSLISLLITSLSFIVLIFIFAQQIAVKLQYTNHKEYIIWFGIIMAADAFSTIPFARLRMLNKAFKFAMLKIAGILIFIAMNLFFLVLCPWVVKNNPQSILSSIYSPDVGVGYVFIANLISSLFTIVILLPEMLGIKYKFDPLLWKKIMIYSLPLLVAGLAGMINETMDRILLKHYLPAGSDVMGQVGIYGANYKVAMLMTLFVQMFRYAAEPFFFSHAKDTDAKKMYADIMKYFVIFCLLIFLGVTFYIDIVKFFIGEKFYSGLKIVPIVLLANMFLGIIINLSIWYKLTNLTRYGAYLALFGALITIGLNIWLIPLDNPTFGGYMGAAWATFFCYLLMMIASFFVGRKIYKIQYELKTILLYMAIAIGFYLLSEYLRTSSFWLTIGMNTMLLVIFLLIIIAKEKLILLLVRNKKE